ncbi:MAG TPA: EVE domain-containing protein [Rhizobium sp.]|nr:EVE domain-containing protein [Rhizobium sp.]
MGTGSVSTIRRCDAMAWIVVASADHVARGVEGGFVQACHGKDAPLRRIRPGETVTAYSPTMAFGGPGRLQAFTAIGSMKARAPYRVEMSADFHPFRRDIDWHAAQPAPILPLLDRLELTHGKRNWSYSFRFGIVRISAADAEIIASAMMASLVAGDVWPPGQASFLPLLGI